VNAVAAAEGRGFRVKLLLAMMLVVSAITGSALFFAQRSLRDAERRHLEHEFQGELRHLLSLEEVRLAAITERCRALANSVRIRAALEEDAIADLYLNAEVELRDLLDESSDRSPGDNRSLRAEFFRFLNGKGALISANPGTSPQSLQPWEVELSLADGVPGSQQIGFVSARIDNDVEAMYQVVATPIIATESGEAIGALVLGFKTSGIESQSGDMGLISGILRRGRLQMPGLPDRAAAASLEAELSHSVSSVPTGTSLRVDVAGQPHLLFYTLLNANSKYPPTYQVCLFSLADSLEQQRELRWQILGSGCVLLLGALAISHFISSRLARPVEKLAKDSAANLEQKKWAEAALELTAQKYRSIFENAIEGIFLLSPEGRCLSANPAFARIYGFSSPAHAAAEFDKRRDQLFADPDRHQQILRAAEAQGAVSNYEAQVNRLDGTRIWISQNLRVVRDDSGALLHFEGTVEDITARKHAADELLALNAELQAAVGTLKTTQQQIIQQERLRALGQMASGIAHDFNNALVPILGFCELLLIRPAILDDKAKAGAYLETIRPQPRMHPALSPDCGNSIAQTRATNHSSPSISSAWPNKSSHSPGPSGRIKPRQAAPRSNWSWNSSRYRP
jgi:PAS domain S-box-containing protein